MNNIKKQFAIDLNCKPEELENNIFVYASPNDYTSAESRSNGIIIIYQGKLYIRLDHEDLTLKLENKYKEKVSDWFFEPSNILQLESLLLEHDYFISEWKMYFLPFNDELHDIDTTNLVYYHDDELMQFKGDSRFDECFMYDEAYPDRIGIAYVEDGEILGMCGSNQTGTYMFEMGINTMPGSEGKGIAPLLVKATMNEIRRISDNTCIPIYGTQFSHMRSINVALRSGYKAGWTQINILKKKKGN